MSNPTPITKLNFLGRISHFFATNQSLSILLLIGILLFGLVSFFITPKQYNPEINRPAFLVSLNYEGATIQQSLDRVVFELVEKINTIPGVDDIYTEVADGGAIETTVIFEVGHDISSAKLNLRSQLDQYEFLAQGFIGQPHIFEINPETIPILQIAFTSATGTPATLREDVARVVQHLGAVSGVSALTIHGGHQEAVIVELQPERMQVAGVTAEAVTNTLRSAQYRSVQSGITSGLYTTESVFTSGAMTVEELGALPIVPDVRVRDVATVYRGVAGERSSVWYSDGENQGEVVMLGVAKVEGSSAPVVSSELLTQLNRLLAGEEYHHLSYQVVGNDGATATAEINGLSQNLLTSIVIVAIVLMLFLSFRAALVVLIAIPTTLLIVFGIGFLFDQTINRITLFALILSLGLLVDSAIVVVENIYAHVHEWKASKDLVKKERVIAQAVSEVGVGLVLSTITSVIVFLPMAYITGMMGPYMGPIAFFVPMALIVSLLVAIIVTPFIAARVIGGPERPFSLNVWFTKRLTALTNQYTRFLRKILSSRNRQKILLRGALVLFIISLVLPATGLVHFQMLPKADRDQVYVYIDLPPDASVEYTKEVTHAIDETILQIASVSNTQSYIGEPPIVDFNGMFKGAQGRDGKEQATMRVNFVPSQDRSESSSELATEMRKLVADQLPQVASYVRVIEEPPGPPVRATFVAKVSADNQSTQDQVANSLYEMLVHVDGVTDRYVGVDEPVGRTEYRFDFEAVEEFGVSMQSAAETISLLGGPVTIGEVRTTDNAEQTHIVLSLPARYRDAPLDVANSMVETKTGSLVPLATVVTAETTNRPSNVELESSTPVTFVTAEVSERSIVYAMIDVMRLIARDELSDLTLEDWSLFDMTLTYEPTGEPVTLAWGGEWEMTLENFRDLGIAMIVALVLVYGVLVAQYNRFATPAYILVTVPLGLVGILWGFFLLDTTANIYLTATALIGFIALIGLVVNNAIIFLEYVEQALRSGRSFQESLLLAGEARLRPILLTSLTTILASLTIASDPVWSGLAWAIVFGLSLSTVLTLIVYPTLLMYYTSHTYNYNE
jgi:multidrug efflux pump subunit AcrB